MTHALRPSGAPLRRLLAALLLLQVVLAPALCLARGAAVHGAAAVEICTPDGLRLIHLGPEESGQPDTPGHAGHDGFCLACHGLPQAALPAVPALPAPAWTIVAATHAAATAVAPLPPIRGPPSGPRAPPSLLS